jgi:hypothetical protein
MALGPLIDQRSLAAAGQGQLNPVIVINREKPLQLAQIAGSFGARSTAVMFVSIVQVSRIASVFPISICKADSGS